MRALVIVLAVFGPWLVIGLALYAIGRLAGLVPA